MIGLRGQTFRLCGAVDPRTNQVPRYLYATTKRTTRWFLTDATDLMPSNVLSMTPITSAQFSLQTATDFESFSMDIGTRSNMYFQKQNIEHYRSQIVSAMSR